MNTNYDFNLYCDNCEKCKNSQLCKNCIHCIDCIECINSIRLYNCTRCAYCENVSFMKYAKNIKNYNSRLLTNYIQKNNNLFLRKFIIELLDFIILYFEESNNCIINDKLFFITIKNSIGFCLSDKYVIELYTIFSLYPIMRDKLLFDCVIPENLLPKLL